MAKVFISYAHEKDMSTRVKALADWLIKQGVEVITDHKHADRPPDKGWHIWMLHSVEDSDTVLMVCTERYKALFEKREVSDTRGLGVRYEGSIITSDLYNARMVNTKFFPILPEDGNPAHIPTILRAFDNGHKFPSGNAGILRLIGVPEQGDGVNDRSAQGKEVVQVLSPSLVTKSHGSSFQNHKVRYIEASVRVAVKNISSGGIDGFRVEVILPKQASNTIDFKTNLLPSLFSHEDGHKDVFAQDVSRSVYPTQSVGVDFGIIQIKKANSKEFFEEGVVVNTYSKAGKETTAFKVNELFKNQHHTSCNWDDFT